MKGKIIARRLNVVLIGLILCGIFVYGVFLPLRGHHMAMMAKGGPFDGAFWPWLLYLWGTAVPCVVAVGYAFSITRTLREGRMFTPQNARRLLMIARWAIGDTVYFFIGQILVCHGMEPPRSFPHGVVYRVCRGCYCDSGESFGVAGTKSGRAAGRKRLDYLRGVLCKERFFFTLMLCWPDVK